MRKTLWNQETWQNTGELFERNWTKNKDETWKIALWTLDTRKPSQTRRKFNKTTLFCRIQSLTHENALIIILYMPVYPITFTIRAFLLLNLLLS